MGQDEEPPPTCQGFGASRILVVMVRHLGRVTREETGVRQEWEPEDLIEVWTLLEEDQERLRNKSGRTGWGSRCC